MKLNRRQFVGTAVAATAFPAIGQSWPTQPIRVIVPFAAGGPTDFVARMIAIPLSNILGQPVVVENRAGASGNIGAQSVAESPADGYTLVHTTAAMQALNPLMYPSARFDVSKNLTPIGITAALPNVLVVNPVNQKFQTVAELAAKGKERENELTYATFGNGTSPHIYGALLQKLAQFTALAIPYKGSGPAATDLLAGSVDFLFDNITTSLGLVQSGKLKALAITSNKRTPLLPDVPTMKEAGYPDFELQQWFALQAPASTPAPIVERLRQAVAKAASEVGYQKNLTERGAESVVVTASEVERFVVTHARKWSEVAKTINLKPE
ncbi:Bug family tripartite tricarboxylate transporter substrate binding protein [Hydrogenophaga palleronii]|uniref:Bug family tripartite tricarboxylate transporter substrate binding protein n=1 Tax=Hydrogenophaga palleronii TaxID=65655 RepID=UPI000824CC1B|nr:tripartite tricarboxylate transporter substrate binding protein [Hydrogenophaga palleronii]